MKISNTELRLIVGIYKEIKVDSRINIHGRLYISCPSNDGSVDRIDFENNVINLNINSGKLRIEDKDNVLEYLKILKPEYKLVRDEDLIWLSDVEFNQVTVDNKDFNKEDFLSNLLVKYMRVIDIDTLDLLCTIKDKYNNLILFRDGVVYREYVDIDTDPDQPYLLLFEDSLTNLLNNMEYYEILGISPNYEVKSRDNYLKQLGRISCMVPFKFRVVTNEFE